VRGIRNAAATVVLAYVLRLHESSVKSLTTRALNITHTATKDKKKKVLVKVFRTRRLRRRRTRGQELFVTYHRALTAL
jgi:GT2 family glycosyltransferase